MKRIDNTPLVPTVPAGEGSFQIEFEDRESQDAHPADLIRLFLAKLPVKTMDDADRGHRLMEIMSKAKDTIDMDDSDRSWLVKQATVAGPLAIGLMAVELVKILAGAEDLKVPKK